MEKYVKKDRKDFRSKGPKRGSRDRKSFGDRRRMDSGGDRSRGRRDSGRDSGRDRPRRDRGDLQMTRVTCSACGDKCEVPFKPTTDKPVFCSDCFRKKSGSSGGSSDKDLSSIHKKLDKIMEALDIE